MMPLNRKKQPALSEISVAPMAEPAIERLSNKIPVYSHNAGSEEITRLEFWFRAGSSSEKKPLAASSANMMLMEGTNSYSAEKLASKLDFYGTHPQMFIDRDSAGMSILFLNRHIENVLPLCREILFEPVFPTKEFSQLNKKRLQWFSINRQKVATLAAERFNELLFGCDHPYGRALKKEYFREIKPEDAKLFHSERYTPQNMAIFASGRLRNDLNKLLEKHFGDIASGEPEENKVDELPAYHGGESDYVKKKGAVQAAIRIGTRTITKTNPDYFGLKILDTIIGGYFGSRLMKNLREDKGYTYGIHSSVISYALTGQSVISAEVGAGYTDDAIREIIREIDILRNEAVPDSELHVVKNYMLGELVRMFDGPFSVSESYRSAWEFGLDGSYYSRFADTVRNITSDEILKLASAYYNPGNFTRVVAGP